MGLLRLLVILAAACSRLPAYEMEQPPAQSAPLSLEEVLKLCREGISEEVVIARIKRNGRPFDLNAEELVELKKAGVTENVIKFLLDPSQPYAPPAPRADPTTPPPSKPAGPARKYPGDPNLSRLPSEPGMYRISEGAPASVPVKLLLGEKQGGGLGKILLKKGHVVAYLVGAASNTQAGETPAVFYIRLPEGKGIEELLLLALSPRNGRRELDMGAPGPKAEFRPEAIRPFDSVEIGAGVFRLSAAGLANGEYVFFLRGTEDPAKGNYGKGYDFGARSGPAKGQR